MSTSNASEIIVSVIMVTYNHKDFLAKALDSILSQKTDYRYEIILHDDASTDGTTDIVRQYSERYPDIIVPIIEEENIYSKGTVNMMNIIEPYIRGKYLLFCDGDDYWTDDDKIQIQVDFLEKNGDYSAHTHKCLIKRWDGVEYDSPKKTGTEWSSREIINWKDCFHTTTVMMRKEVYMHNKRDILRTFGAADYVNAVFCIAAGKVYFLDRVMSCHLFGLPGSFTANNFIEEENQREYERITRHKDMLKVLDDITEGKFHEDFLYAQQRREFAFYYKTGQYKKLLKDCKMIVKEKGFKSGVYIRMAAYFPGIIGFYEKLKGKK